MAKHGERDQGSRKGSRESGDVAMCEGSGHEILPSQALVREKAQVRAELG